KAEKIEGSIEEDGKAAASVLDVDVWSEARLVFDLGVSSLLLGADPGASETPALTEAIFGEMKRAGVRVGVGSYNEARPLYRSARFGSVDKRVGERRRMHLGRELFVEPSAAA